MAETIVNNRRWSGASMIVWGNSIGRRGPTVHLPGELAPYGASTGATAACDRRPKLHVLCAWTFSFGGPRGGRVRLCRRCFKLGKPNPALRPAAGWLRYVWPARPPARGKME